MKKALGTITLLVSVLLVISCQDKIELNDSTALASAELPADYMYTLTIPEIMELNISDTK